MKQEPAAQPCPAPAITESFGDNKQHPADCSTAQSTWVSMSGVFANFVSTDLKGKHISTGEAELQPGGSGGCLDGWMDRVHIGFLTGQNAANPDC